MNLIDFLWAYILVFVLAAIPFFEVATIIPIAILAGLQTGLVLLFALLGNLLTVVLVIIFVDKIKQWREKRARKKMKEESPQQMIEGEGGEEGQTEAVDLESKRSKRARSVWKKYGLPGLALLGPLLIGSHLAAFLSLVFGGSKKATTYWMTGSLVLWSLLLAIFTHFGFDYFGDRESGGFLIRLFEQQVD
ncbi:small multi-drug export protein [Caldalkalibacillus mannanilyticus]|uniref:small multi-drug export protein n=1 Tax=Caldalkalibacillus mannanilyticus TaxID=1418 RepID=UPI000688A143|nr:small multi-drug export protein [Caldalkalibacillus mannanilyticus]